MVHVQPNAIGTKGLTSSAPTGTTYVLWFNGTYISLTSIQQML